MSEDKTKMTFEVRAQWIDSHGSEATCKSASIALDTDQAGRVDSFPPGYSTCYLTECAATNGID